MMGAEYLSLAEKKDGTAISYFFLLKILIWGHF